MVTEKQRPFGAGDATAGPMLIEYKWADATPAAPPLIEAEADDGEMAPLATWASSC